MKSGTRKSWTKEEELYLIDVYSSKNTQEIADILGRTLASIKRKASKLNLQKSSRKPWTDEEDLFLLENYPVKGIVYCQEKLGRTKESIKNRTRTLKLNRHKGPTSRKTTEDYKKELPEDLSVLEAYVDNNTPILHKHMTCGNTWKARPRTILSGNSCPSCSNTGYCASEPAYVYFVYFANLNLWKIGIAKNIDRRLNTLGYPYNILASVYLESGIEAREIEQLILNEYKVELLNTGLLKSGNTETLFLNPKQEAEILSFLEDTI